jgi:hypothetical protein
LGSNQEYKRSSALGVITVHQVQSFVAVMCKLGLLALLGLAFIFLIGPVIALVSVVFSLVVVLLPFALLGLVVWVLFQSLVRGKPVTWEEVRHMGENAGRPVVYVAQKVPQVLRGPFHAASAIAARITRGGQWFWSKFWSTARVVGEVSLVTAAGILVGLLVGLIVGIQNHDVHSAVVSNGITGGALAAVVGIAMTVLERKAALKGKHA